MAYWIKRKCKKCGGEFLATPHGRVHCAKCWNDVFFTLPHSDVPVTVISPARITNGNPRRRQLPSE